MGRPKKMNDPVRVDLQMERKTVKHLDDLATQSGTVRSQLIRDAVDEKYPSGKDTDTKPKNRKLTVNVKRALEVIHAFETQMTEPNQRMIYLRLTRLAMIMDIPYRKMQTVVNIAREFLEAKGWSVVLEPVNQQMKIEGRRGTPRTIPQGWKIHSSNKPFTQESLAEARATLEREFKTLGYVVRVPIGETDDT